MRVSGLFVILLLVPLPLPARSRTPARRAEVEPPDPAATCTAPPSGLRRSEPWRSHRLGALRRAFTGATDAFRAS